MDLFLSSVRKAQTFLGNKSPSLPYACHHMHIAPYRSAVHKVCTWRRFVE